MFAVFGVMRSKSGYYFLCFFNHILLQAVCALLPESRGHQQTKNNALNEYLVRGVKDDSFVFRLLFMFF